ncbi:MAG TPA: glutamate--tRNA ligase [Candidatus Pacearchaeota archaeon]|nr:glutamate--tRNA ligase [Candidatus Pacearchaeota archaeon]HPO68581.1 glutamate--tRNA ligase [Candidatus Pacearchaeota archaeon]
MEAISSFSGKNKNVRTRFAPSPTGLFHIGSARTALFNYLFAKKEEGSFILRIEDTDKERSNSIFENDIIENLKWLGILWDEGPVYNEEKINGKNFIGDYGPYRQSERTEIYKKYLEKLLEEKKAYYCFCTPEELEAKRQYQISIGNPYHYDGKCAGLSEKEILDNLKQGKKYVIRLKVPAKKIEINDLIRGKVEFNTELLGDIIIAKDLNAPLFNFSGAIDDFEMKITHVIRGEDHLSNTPKQIIIQEALGFYRPYYAHLPLILGPDKSKLSKRHGAVSVSEYKKDGYLKEALINMIALLGWNPGNEKEIYSLKELIKDFSIEKINKSGAIFNIKKLDYLNGFYIRQKSINEITELCLPYLIEARLIIPIIKEQERILSFKNSFEKEIIQEKFLTESEKEISLEEIKKIISLYQERLKKLSEITELTDFFFKKEIKYEKDLLKWKTMTEKDLLYVLDKLEEILSKIEEKDFNKDNLKEILDLESEKTGKELNMIGDRGHLLWPLRVALTGKEASAGPFEIAEILGKDETIKRIRAAKNLILDK